LRKRFGKVYIGLAGLISVIVFITSGCHRKPEQQKITKKKVDYIRPIPGKSDSIPVAAAQRGEVLIAYSDCYTCHKIDQKSIGPAFRDIAKRYPVNKAYVDMLAQKVISGGSGVWGSPIMAAHPDISMEDARTMVLYVLSLKE
jgi:cytochrome c